MSQFSSRNLVEKYIEHDSLGTKKKQLIVSLYATLENANPKVLDSLKKNIINLNDCFTEKEILLLKKEYKDVIKLCHKLWEQEALNGELTYRIANHPLIIPKSLLDLCCNMIDIKAGAEVYLPYFGAAQFAFANPNCKYEGVDEYPENWAFSQIYALCYDVAVKTEKSPIAIPPLGKQYDIIFSYPPFLYGREKKNVIDYLCFLASKSLKVNGTMCCILPFDFCNDSDWFKLRSALTPVHNKYSVIVLSLPSNLYPFNSYEMCLFILKKEEQDKQCKVLLADVSSEHFCAQHDLAGTKVFELKTQSIIETITKNDEQYVWMGTPSELSDNLNLTPSRYVHHNAPILNDGEKLVRLRDLIEFVPRERFDNPGTEYKFINTKMLSTNFLRSDICGNNIEPTLLPLADTRVRKISKNQCYLFGFRGKKAFVGKLVDFKNDDIIVLSGDIIPFRLNENAPVLGDYLLNCLLSDRIEKQLRLLNGSEINETQENDFRNLCVIVPPIEEQNRLCKESSRNSLSEADKKLLDSAEEFRRDIHMKKHAIGQTIFNLNNWWKVLLRARKDGNGIVDDNAVVGNVKKVAVKDIYSNLQQAINQLQEQINRFDRGNGLVTEDFALTDFIEDYIEKHKSPIFQFVDYDSLSHRNMQTIYGVEEDENGDLHNTDEIMMEMGEPFEWVKFPKEALTIIFDNIISNACSHGFDNKESDQNKIKIELDTDGLDYVITISNNGKPVSEDVTGEFVFTYNKSTRIGSSHYGIGGYEVLRLMRDFDGDAEFISQPDNQFPVAYKLIFHNTNLEEPDF